MGKASRARNEKRQEMLEVKEYDRRLTLLDRCIAQSLVLDNGSWKGGKTKDTDQRLGELAKIWGWWRSRLFQAQMVVSNNVWEYCYGMKTFQVPYRVFENEWGKEDDELLFPGDYIYASEQPFNQERWIFYNLIPPFEHTFIEFDRVGSPYEPYFKFSYGVYIHSIQTEGEGRLLTFRTVIDNAFLLYNSVEIMPLEEITLSLTKEGVFEGDLKLNIRSQVKREFDEFDICPVLYATLMTLQFLNTRNTVLIDNQPPAKLSKRHEKKYGVPLVTYKTLKVLPMRKVNQNDYDPATDGDTSIPRSLHIARGHFKDYRNGPGLFGKYQDIFWWDAHVRGSAETGVVVKDYDVQAPEHEAS